MVYDAFSPINVVGKPREFCSKHDVLFRVYLDNTRPVPAVIVRTIVQVPVGIHLRRPYNISFFYKLLISPPTQSNPMQFGNKGVLVQVLMYHQNMMNTIKGLWVIPGTSSYYQDIKCPSPGYSDARTFNSFFHNLVIFPPTQPNPFIVTMQSHAPHYIHVEVSSVVWNLAQYCPENWSDRSVTGPCNHVAARSRFSVPSSLT